MLLLSLLSPQSRWEVSHYAALLCTPGCLWGYNYQSSCNPSCPCIWSLVAFGVVLEVFPPLLAMTQFEAFEGWRVNSRGFYGDGWHPDWSSRLHCPQPIKLSTLSCLHWLCECIFSLCDAFSFPSGLKTRPSAPTTMGPTSSLLHAPIQGSWFDIFFFTTILGFTEILNEIRLNEFNRNIYSTVMFWTWTLKKNGQRPSALPNYCCPTYKSV